MTEAEKYLPGTVSATLPGDNIPTTFKLEKKLGSGGEGAAAVYVASNGKRVTVKAQFCTSADAYKKGEEEARIAAGAARVLKGGCMPENCQGCTVDSNAIRQPLSTVQVGPCSLALYPYVHLNLAQWLSNTPNRLPWAVLSLFEQAIGIVVCLQDKGYYYSDIKPSNFLVIQDSGADSTPRLVIGDLGGLVTKDAKDLQIPTGRVPPTLLKDFTWNKMDQVTSFMLATLGLELVLRAPSQQDPSSPLDSFFLCLQRNALDQCIDEVIKTLKSHLAEGLTLEGPIQGIVAISLALMGYKNAYVRPAIAAGLLDQSVKQLVTKKS